MFDFLKPKKVCTEKMCAQCKAKNMEHVRFLAKHKLEASMADFEDRAEYHYSKMVDYCFKHKLNASIGKKIVQYDSNTCLKTNITIE